MIYEDPRFPNRKKKNLDQSSFSVESAETTPPAAPGEDSEPLQLHFSGYKVIDPPQGPPAEVLDEAVLPAPAAEPAAAPPQAPVAEAPIPPPAFREKAIAWIRELAQNPAKFYTYIGAGAVVFFALIFVVGYWLFGGTEGRYDLGTADSTSAGLTGHLYVEWDKKLDYRLTISPSDPVQQAGFALAASSPPRPLSVEIHLQNSEGFVLCSKEILLRFDARKAAALAANLPGMQTASVDAANPAADQPTPEIDFARLAAEEAERVRGKDVFQNQTSPDGQLATINAQGQIPCTKSAYEKATAWSFTTNFPSLAEQNGLLDLQKGPQTGTENSQPSLPAASSAHAARKKIPVQKLLPYTVEGDDSIVDFDLSQGVISTRGRKIFFIDKAAAASANPAWQDFPVSIHYHCDQSSACVLTHSGLGGLRVRMKR